MVEDYKEWVRQLYDRAASQFGQNSCSFFSHFGRQLVEHVPVKANQQVLDVATGRGALLFPLAEKVGPLGKVVGIDISEQMIKETSAGVKKSNINWVELLQMDAEHLNFPENSFDAVFCGFALFFFPSLSKTLSEFKRVLKPGGFIGVSTWGKDSELDALVHSEFNPPNKPPSFTAHSLWSGQSLQNELDKAGFKDVKIIEETKRFQHPTPEEWWNSLWTHGIRAKLEHLSPEQLTEFHEKLMEKAKALDKGNGLAEDIQVFYGIAKAGD